MTLWLNPTWMDDLWAKSADKGEGGEAESLARHTWFVLERLAAFIRLRPSLPQQLGQDDLWHLLFWAAFFHDFGKAMPSFQGVLRGEQDARETWGKNRHEVFSLAFLQWAKPALSSEQVQWIAAAIVSHHREPDEIQNIYPEMDEDEEDWLDHHLKSLQPAVIEGLWRWTVDCANGWIIALGLQEFGVCPLTFLQKQEALSAINKQGTASIRTTLRSYRRFIRTLNEKDSEVRTCLLALRGFMINADHMGSAHVEPMPAPCFTHEDLLSSRGETPYDHQQLASETNGSALLIAPTGSGKTEAALLWVTRQSQLGITTPRLFYTLPYQASMNAMRLRLENTFGVGNVGLQHGRALLALYRQLMERSDTPAEAANTARRMRNLARLNHPPVRVFSPYQILKGMFRLKGYEAQLSDYHNALFIVDEIHAYEVTRLAMILKTIEYLRRYYHASFFVMSATFPSLIKGWLEEALDHPVEINAQPALFQEFQRHELRVEEGDLLSDEYLRQIAEEAQGGKSVLVVCNIVARAQQVFDQLKERLSESAVAVPVMLLHGRFNMRDRMLKEEEIRVKTGTHSGQRSPIVLVATQVVEVSLDIDLDTIYTDPAPLEALVQRFGRVNRGRKIKPYARVHVFTQPDDGQRIYEPALIERTLKILKRENGHPIDESAIGGWLDEIYEGEIADEWEKQFAAAGKEFEEICINTLRPFSTADEMLEDRFNKMFDGTEVLPDALFEEYEQKRESEPIAANELLVPMRWGQYHMLMGKGLMKPGDRSVPPVALCPYSSELGLTLEKLSKPDDWDE